jgi:hypothetical protein
MYSALFASRRPDIKVDCSSHDCAAWREDQGRSPTSAQFTTITVASESSARGLQKQFAKMAASKDKYSVILPTYNERQNLPVLVQMLYDVFTKE